MISTVRGLECKLMTFLASLIYGNSYSSWTLSSMVIICGGRFCVVYHFGRSALPLWDVGGVVYGRRVCVDCGRRFCVGMKRVSVWGLGISCVL